MDSFFFACYVSDNAVAMSMISLLFTSLILQNKNISLSNTMGNLIKKIPPELTPFFTPGITPNYVNYGSIHDSVHYFTVHVSGEVLTFRQLDISCKS